MLCNQASELHIDLQEVERNQRRVLAVVMLTTVTMVVEVVAGRWTGSMALEADGYHMASHAGALGIAYLAYRFVRSPRLAQRMNFGAGKVLALGGYSSALGLAAVAVWMIIESISRLLNPRPIQFDEALLVTAVGLGVNLLSAWMLGWGSHHHHHPQHADHAEHSEVAHSGHHHHSHDHCEHHAHHHHSHDHEEHHVPQGHSHAHAEDHMHPVSLPPLSMAALPPQSHLPTHTHSHDHNHQGALMHVLADALTSVLALIALVLGRFAPNTAWLDPVIGIVGALVILRWAWGLLKHTSAELLDCYPAGVSVDALKEQIEKDGHRVWDLHLWSQGRGTLIGMLSVTPANDATDFRTYFKGLGRGVHLSVEKTAH